MTNGPVSKTLVFCVTAYFFERPLPSWRDATRTGSPAKHPVDARTANLEGLGDFCRTHAGGLEITHLVSVNARLATFIDPLVLIKRVILCTSSPSTVKGLC